MSYISEPWEYAEEIHEAGKLKIFCYVARKAGGKSPCDNIIRLSGDGEDTIRRIVACVNACKDVPTEWLEEYALLLEEMTMAKKFYVDIAKKDSEISSLHSDISTLKEKYNELFRVASEMVIAHERKEPSPFGLALDHEMAMRSSIDIARAKLISALGAVKNEETK